MYAPIAVHALMFAPLRLFILNRIAILKIVVEPQNFAALRIFYRDLP
jgi:hypothetical protein